MPKARSGSSLPECGFVYHAANGDQYACRESGPHFCWPRALKVEAFFAEVLVHTKGMWARKPFVLAEWQREEIIYPMFGEVRFDEQWDRYVRQYNQAWIEVARGNGKSEIMAGCALYLEMGDDEESAEVYGAAKDVKQAGKVWEVAERMLKLSPVLLDLKKSGTIKVNVQAKRIIYEPTGSFYEIVTSDAAGELGAAPHGVMFDEVITQKTRDLWAAFDQALGKRTQPLMIGATTAGTKSTPLALAMHKKAERAIEDPSTAPRLFVFMRNTPADADIHDRKWWHHSNPALGDFLSESELANRIESAEKDSDPAELASVKQFGLNMWGQGVAKWMPLTLWLKNAGEKAPNQAWVEERLKGMTGTGGMDLSATTDLTAIAYIFEGEQLEVEEGEAPERKLPILARHWVPRAVMDDLNAYTGQMADEWVEQGWLVATDGDTIDYDEIYEQIERDHNDFRVSSMGHDPWSAAPAVQEIAKRTGLELVKIGQKFELSPAMKEIIRLAKKGALEHFGNPVLEWCMDCVEVRVNVDNPDEYRPVKPSRMTESKRIDGALALSMGMDRFMRRPAVEEVVTASF